MGIVTSSEFSGSSVITATQLIITDASGNVIVQIGTDPSVQIFNNGNQILVADTFGLRVLNTSGQLIASIAQQDESLPHIGEVLRGITSYDPTVTDVALEMDQGQLKFWLQNQDNPFFNGSLAVTNPAAHNVASYLSMQAASTNVAPDQAFVQVGGLSEDGSDPARVIVGKTVPGDVDLLVWGTAHYGQIGSTVPEQWHDVSFASGWSNAGSPPTPWAPVRYKRTNDGRIVFVGLAVFSGTTTAPSTVFTLDATHRPDRQVNLTSSNNPAATGTTTPVAVQVQTNGVVTVTNFAGTVNPGPVSFENLGFYMQALGTIA